jgi:hypothetical protein
MHDFVSQGEGALFSPNILLITSCLLLHISIANHLQAAPKKVPELWFILRRKYDPYKNTIKYIDLVKDELQRVEKLDISLCTAESEIDSDVSRKTPSQSTPSGKHTTSISMQNVGSSLL